MKIEIITNENFYFYLFQFKKKAKETNSMISFEVNVEDVIETGSDMVQYIVHISIQIYKRNNEEYIKQV